MAGHIIAVVGGKGGVGKSVFAANLMLAWMQDMRQRPLLVDADLNSLGDQNIILNQNPSKSLVDVSKIQGPVDLKALTPLLVNAQAGYSYIGAPRDAISARDLDLEGYGKFLKAATTHFPCVIVDCGSSMDPVALKTFEYATAIFVVTTADVIVVNQTKRILSKIQELLFPPEMVQIIINRFSQSTLITPAMIQKNLGRQVFGAVPEDVASCDAALSKSIPVMLAAPASSVAKSIHDLVRRMQQVQLLENLSKLKKPSIAAAKVDPSGHSSHGFHGSQGGGLGQSGPGGRSAAAPLDAWTSMKLRIHKALIDAIDLKKTNTDTADPKQRAILREKTQKAILDILQTEDTGSLLTTRELKAQIVKEVLDEALGLGPLEDLLADETVNEIMVNSRDQIYIEKAGKNLLSKVTFSSEQQMMNVVERIVMPLGRRVDEKTPYVDARLQDGSRVHIIIPPLALRGPTITIRKFPKKRFEAKDLIAKGSATDEIMDFLRCCIEAQLNIVVSGGTGSGKTTLLNVLSNYIPATERIITVEDSAELQLGQEHVVRLETRPKNIEGEGEVSIRDLIKNTLRMKPHRIIVGECRDGAALDMLQAMNTGHSGSMTTLHSNNPRECLQRLETLVMMAGVNLPSKAIKETIASAVNLIIQQTRLSDGSRRITYITEVTGMQGDVISLQDIFVFKQEGMDKNRKIIGRFVPTGFVPKFVEEMEAKGMRVSRSLFSPKAPTSAAG
ncbi:MAG: ATPase, T2SS/T4P/T4SS family [Oligoflexia bacterium]|jgi:pilus assembly protein CpaF